MGEGGQRRASVAFTPGKDAVPIVQEAGWALEVVWIGAENLTPTWFRSPDLPAHSKQLYRLHHPSSLGYVPKYVSLYRELGEISCKTILHDKEVLGVVV
jgi:hypothetical protein